MNKWLKIGQGKGQMAPLHSSTDITDVEDLSKHNDLSNTDKPIRLGFWVLIVGFGCFMLWSAFAPLDEGVSAPASVSIESKRKTIQHLNGGVIRSVLVKEGQTVKAGDVLVELDEGVSKANFEAVRQNYMGQRASESRLLAEQVGAERINFHLDLLKAASDPLVMQHMQSQTLLFQSRRSALQAEMQAGEENLGGLKAQFESTTAMLENRRNQAALQEQQIKSVKELAAEGYAPKNQVLQLEQSQSELRSLMADLQGNLNRIQRSMAEVHQRLTQRKQEYLKDVSQQLADVRREVQSGQDKLRAVTEELARTQVKSPVDGQVVGMQVSSVGGVVTPGQRLMDVVPNGEPLVVDAKIPPHIIDKVYSGEEVEVRFSTFANSPQLVLDAKLVSVSKDVINEQTAMGVQSFYLARAAISDEGMKTLGKRVLQPGMPAEVLIKTGERSLLTYLLHPLTKRIAASMKEE
jgi:membrane fusion protein, protease secretion system